MQNLLPDARYLWRELLPRAVLMTVSFKWLLPLTTLFRFEGGLPAAIVFGVVFTGWFSLWGAYIMGGKGAQAFLERNKEKRWLPILHIALMVVVPAVALIGAALSVPAVFGMDWLWGTLAGVIALNAVCAATHDYGRRDD